MTEFKKISMEDRELIKGYLLNDNNLSCEFSFGNNILWNPEDRLEYQIVEDVLLYRMIFEDAHKVLKERSMMFFEMGYDQKENLTALAREFFPSADINVYKDINNKDRMLVIKLF